MEVDEPEWELSKENVQPLRRGRQVSSLVLGLHRDQDEERNIKALQHEFEMQLRTYSGDDPYDVWDRYIKWTEQYFPKGGHDGQLVKLIERCLREFQADERYTNDPRFIHMWIKFACFSEDPTDLFAYMFNNGIGDKVAALYVEWAMSLERQGDTKRADAIYVEGLNRRAEPRDMIVEKQQQFQNRVARNITLQIAESQNPGMDMGEETAQRSALGRLKGSGSSQKVGTTRTGSVLLGSAGSLKSSKPIAPKQVPGQSIPIYSDAENVPPSLQPPQTKEWQSMPVKRVDNRENDKKPGVWTGAKLKQSTGVVSSAPAGIPFEIHTDPETDQAPLETPRKTTLMTSQPLSSRKLGKTDVLSNIRQQSQPASSSATIKEVPAYQKDKVYNGLLEFSFEELRAAKYWKQRKKREAEEERLRLEEERRQREEILQQQLQATTERLSALEALLRNRIGDLDINAGVSQPQPDIQSSSLSEQEKSGEVAQLAKQQQPSLQTMQSQRIPLQSRQDLNDTSISAQTDPDFITPDQAAQCKGTVLSSTHNKSQTSLRTPIFNSASSYTATSSCGSVSSSFNRSMSKGLKGNTLTGILSSSTTPSDTEGSFACKPASAHNLSNITPSSSIDSSMARGHAGKGAAAASCASVNSDEAPRDSSLLNSMLSQGKHNHTITPKSGGPTPESTNSFTMKKGPITAPSPTVYTKEAMQCVMGMFSSSFTCDDQPMTEEVESFTAAQPAPQVPFQICEDTTGLLNDENGKGLSDNKKSGLQIYCDDEDRNMVEPGDSLSCAKNAGSTVKKGLQIHGDEEMNDENFTKASHKKASGSTVKKGLQIHSDDHMDEDNFSKSASARKSARRGLGFLPTSGCDDIEMTDIDKEHMNYDFTIECQARSDMTLAPLESFSIQARAASTPYVSGHEKSRAALQEVSDTTSASTCSTSSAATVNYSEGAPTPNKHLSPILEGSGEGCGEDSKSTSQQSQSGICPNITTRSRHGSTQSWEPAIVEEEEDIRADDDRDSSRLQNQVLDRSCHHQIDTTAYIPDLEDDLDDLLSTSVCLDPTDPFDEATVAQLLKMLDPPLTDYPNYIASDRELPDPSVDCHLQLISDGIYIMADDCIGEGGYAKIYKMSEIDNNDTINTSEMACTSGSTEKIVKVQAPPAYWEFYVNCEMRRRLINLRAEIDVTPSIMTIERGFFFKDKSALEMNYVPFGSLLNFVNKFKGDRQMLADVESIACLLTIELLHLFEQIHKTGFIHGDVKPDNFLFLGLGSVKQSKNPHEVFGPRLRLVQLIDFGQSIDLTKFPRGTKFMAKIVTSGFQCIEMRTNRPWTFQPDLFGLAGTVHVVLFGSYMNVFQERGEWKTTGNFARKWNVPLWKGFFKELLNIPSCEQQPDLASMRREFEQHFIHNLIPTYNSWVERWRVQKLQCW